MSRPTTVLSGRLHWKVPKRKKVSWKHCALTLNSDGKLLEHGQDRVMISLTQQTRIFNSEFRDFCFVVCTPSERKVVLAAQSEEEKERWVSALQSAAKNAPPIHVKIVLVGDEKELQQELLHRFFLQCGQQKLANEIQQFSYRTDNLELNINLDVTGEKVRLMLCCVGAEDYPKLRVLNYVDANGILLCYSRSKADQFENLERTWFPEVEPSGRRGTSLFLLGVKEEAEAGEVVPNQVGEEFANFINGSYFGVDLGLEEDNKSFDSLQEDDSAGPEFFTPGDAFLELLQSTIDEGRGEYLEDEDYSATDVGDLNDFSNNFLRPRKMNFLQFVKSRTRGMTKLTSMKKLGKSSSKLPKVSMVTILSDEEANKKPTTLVERIKALLKTMKPRPRQKKKKNRPKLEEEQIREAHFVSRHKTGSLLFLGEPVED